MSAADAVIQNKIYGSGATAIIILIEETEDIMKIVKLLKESGLLIKEISETNRNAAKEPKGRLFWMLLGTLAARKMRNALAGKGEIRAGEGVIRAGQNS